MLVSRRPVRVDVEEERLRAELDVIPGQFSIWPTLGVGWGDTRLLATVAGFVVHLLTGKGRQWKILEPPRLPLPGPD